MLMCSISATVYKHMVCEGMVVMRTTFVSVNATLRERNHLGQQGHAIPLQ